MNNLILGNNKKLEVTKTRIIKFSAGKLIEKFPVLLLDVSGSMCRDLNGKRRIDILRDAVEKVGNGMETYCFSDTTVKTKYIPEPHGSTNLKGAFQVLKGQSMQLILISDGIADNPNDAIQSAIELKCPVNVLYIGSPGDEGELFMKRLAEMTGGKWITLDTMQDSNIFQTKLENGIQNLLFLTE